MMRESESVDEASSSVPDEAPLVTTREGQVSNTWTLMNVLRGMIGPGCLALPVAFKECGLWAGFVLIFVVGIVNTHCMLMLVHAAQYLCEKSGKLELDYGHLAKKAFDFGPQRFQRHSKRALYATNVVICLLQIGICSVLFVFMASHLKQSVGAYSPTMDEVDVRVYLCMFLVPVILLNLIRELWILAYLSTVANLLIIVSFAIILYSLIASSNEIQHLPSMASSFGPFLSGIGAMLYSFEGQAMILPMENKMKEPQTMIGWNGVLCTGMAITTCLYAATGFFGYASYGQNVTGSIAENFPDTPVYIGVRIMLVIAVFVGYGIQMYIILEMLWPAIVRKLPESLRSYRFPLELVFRMVLVVVTFGIAVAVPKLEDIIPLVGISAGMILALIFPPLLDVITFWDSWLTGTVWNLRFKLAKNVFLISIGVFGAISGFIVSVSKLASDFNSSNS